MDLPKIKALDLRPTMVEVTDEMVWDWPELPRFLKARVIRVTIKADATAFLAAMTEMQARIERMAIFGRPPRYRRRPIRQWYWERITLVLGIFLSIGTCIGLLVDAWL